MKISRREFVKAGALLALPMNGVFAATKIETPNDSPKAVSDPDEGAWAVLLENQQRYNETKSDPLLHQLGLPLIRKMREHMASPRLISWQPMIAKSSICFSRSDLNQRIREHVVSSKLLKYDTMIYKEGISPFNEFMCDALAEATASSIDRSIFCTLQQVAPKINVGCIEEAKHRYFEKTGHNATWAIMHGDDYEYGIHSHIDATGFNIIKDCFRPTDSILLGRKNTYLDAGFIYAPHIMCQFRWSPKHSMISLLYTAGEKMVDSSYYLHAELNQ